MCDKCCDHHGHREQCCCHGRRKQEGHRNIFRTASGMVLFALGIIVPSEAVKLTFFLVAYIIMGYEVLCNALKNLFALRILDENFLMGIATVGAFFTKNYTEGVAVMLLYQIGEMFQSYAVNKSRKSVAELMDIRPDFACVIENGSEKKVNPEAVKPGDVIIIKPGERVPLDGTITEGFTTVDSSALTGESVPCDLGVGAEVLSGSVNLGGVIKVSVTKKYCDSTVSRILELTEKAADKKSVSERFITAFAKYYTPAVVAFSIIVAFVPPLVIGSGFGEWIHRALTFLVISCPCALVISVPLGFFCGIGRASSEGILIKGSSFIESLSKAKTMVFDKTGTLTCGKLSLCSINSVSMPEDELLCYAAVAEKYSNHPVAQGIRRAYGKELPDTGAYEYKELPGLGVVTESNDKSIAAGNAELMKKLGIHVWEPDFENTVIYIAVDGVYAGTIAVEDEIKADACCAVNELKKEGIRNLVMLTGDRCEAAEAVGRKIGISKIYARLLPDDKVRIVESMLMNGESLIFAGDGINDAPVLARADVGVAMGAIGSDAAIEAADVVIMTDELSKLVTAIRIAKKTVSTVRQNIVFSLAIKLFVLIFGAFGTVSMPVAVFADVGVSLIAVLNSVKILKRK